ncbi:MAG: lysophospholipase [Cyclobacteriaceae bacterium]|nr:lysophospholipase [Cyclobacteriaceae bacterium]
MFDTENMEEDITITAQDGLVLRGIHWQMPQPEAILCVVHGFGEHVGRYRHMAGLLGNFNLAVIGVDLRGHGRSQGLRGHAGSYDLLMSDIEELLKYARATYTDLPLFLYGHSMGGNLVINYVLRMPVFEITGFVASSPWLKLAFDPPAWKIKAGQIMARLYPAFRQSSELDTSAISRDPQEVKAYEEDPLVNGKISAGLFQMISDAGEYAMGNIGELKVQGLLTQGMADRIINPDVNHQLAISSEHMEWIAYPDSYHEPHNDLDRESVINNLITWIKRQIK